MNLPFNTRPYYNTDQIANAIDEDDIFNCYLEQVPDIGFNIRRRPGLKLFCDLSTGAQGDGLFWWDARSMLVAVSNGRIFKVQSDGSYTDITTAPLAVGTPVVFSPGQKPDSTPLLYMANGKFVYSDNGVNTAYPTDPETPDTATFVTYLNLKFLANVPNTNQFKFTDVNPASGTSVIDPFYWSSADNPLTAESKGDNLIALTEFLQEIQVWGSESQETWIDDGSTPFSPIPQAASKAAIEAPYSIASDNDNIFAVCVIDKTRCVIMMGTRVPKIISQPIANILASYSTISDAIGQLITVGGMNIYLLHFPTAGKTWAYDINGNTWSQWGTWNKGSGTMGQFIGQHACYAKPWNKHLIMSRLDGKIYEFDRDTYTDDGNIVKSYRRTPWIDYGSLKRKDSIWLRIKIARGKTINGAAYLRFTDNGQFNWSPYIELTLNPIGDRDFMVEIPQMGIYHSRKYEISITDDSDLCFVYAEEEVKMLRY